MRGPLTGGPLNRTQEICLATVVVFHCGRNKEQNRNAPRVGAWVGLGIQAPREKENIMGRTTRMGCVAMVLVGVCALAPAAEILNTNLLTNPGFESGFTGWMVFGPGGIRTSAPPPMAGATI